MQQIDGETTKPVASVPSNETPVGYASERVPYIISKRLGLLVKECPGTRLCDVAKLWRKKYGGLLRLDLLELEIDACIPKDEVQTIIEEKNNEKQTNKED
eukprot:Trichotokara_eunicae@DN3672_c0_g1_i2.p2